MGFVEDVIMKNEKNFKKQIMTPKFAELYRFYNNNLLERVIRIFEYDNLPAQIPQHEIEYRLHGTGFAGAHDKINDTLYVTSGQYAGEQHEAYYDLRKEFSVYAPGYSDVLKIYDGENDGDVVVLRNNGLGTSTMPIINVFSIMLAHIDVTIIHLLISGRKDAIPTVSVEPQRQAVKDWYSALANGTYDAILDPAFSLTKFVEPGNMKITSISEAQEMKERVFDMFYEFIGLHSNMYKKKGNMIAVEAMGAGSSALMLNLDDMLSQRQVAVALINQKFGTNIKVRLAEEIEANNQIVIDKTNEKKGVDLDE